MSKRIIFTGPDGVATVLIPAYNDKTTGQRPGETEAAYLDRVVARNMETGVLSQAATFRVVEETELPTRYYRNAWRFNGTAIVHDMPAARQIKLNQEIRPERNRRLQSLDVEWSRATAQGNTTLAGQIEAKRQTLRDIPATVGPDLDAQATPAALKAYNPPWPT